MRPDPAFLLGPWTGFAVFGLYTPILNSVTTGNTAANLRSYTQTAGIDVVAGNVAGACTALASIRSTATSKLAPADRDAVIAAADAVGRPIGC